MMVLKTLTGKVLDYNMKSDLIIFIDGYISTPDRAEACSELIDQLKSTLPYKVALLNKYSFSWGLDTKVDYYFTHLEGFMVGRPPQDILDKELYDFYMPKTIKTLTFQTVKKDFLPLIKKNKTNILTNNLFIFIL